MSGPFRGLLFSRIFGFRKKKKRDFWLSPVFLMHGSSTLICKLYTVIFNCFPHCIVHDRWVNTNQFYCYLMKQILSYYLICYRDNSSLIIPVFKKRLSGGLTLSSYLTGLPIVLSLQVKPSINYQLYTQFLTITVTVYFLLFSPVELNGFLMPLTS